MNWDHEGQTIAVNPNGQFVVNEVEFDTLAKAKEHIDRKAKEEAATKRERLNVPVLMVENWDEAATAGRLTGVHAGTGALLTIPKHRKYHYVAVYIDCADSRAMVDLRMQLSKEATRVEADLKKYAVEIGYLSPYSLNHEDHSQAIARIKEQVAKVATMDYGQTEG